MEISCQYIPYKHTGSFTNIITDYLEQDEKLQPFYVHPATIDGISKAIEDRRNQTYNRSLLIAELRKQYDGLQLTELQEKHLSLLSSDSTFTICTAHQPNIFTGHLYFIYKIIHAIKLSNALHEHFPSNHFVPVYYMGSEDADLDELNHITIDNKQYQWNTKQTGAVGRMKVDKAFIALMDEMQGQLNVLPHGKELTDLFKACYKEGTTIQQATLQLVHELFKEMGLLVLIPDSAALKKEFNPIVKRELLEQFSHPLVEQTTSALSQHYKVQAGGRPINLFYLEEGLRERIEKIDGDYHVVNSNKRWTEAELLEEVDEHPERFSANVILRGVFQEMILPNIAFIGGGGEVAYWLELKKVFEATGVPYPVLILRNSFLLTNEQHELATNKLGFRIQDLFSPVDDLIKEVVIRNNGVQLSLHQEKEALQGIYDKVYHASIAIDQSLSQHVNALLVKHEKHLEVLEKKMLRAEKRKYDAQQRQLTKLKQQLFPNNNLQERVDNFAFYYAKYGKEWLLKLYEASCTLEQQFCILSTK
jgi:bacillithiol biosynthesis cysteine-adding enzyme BshC